MSADPKDRWSDEALMFAFCQGDEAAFEVIFRRYAEPIRSFLGKLSGNAAEAAEMTQETFVSMVRGRGRFLEGSKLKPWLYTIALNVFRDRFRKKKRELLMPDEELPALAYEALVPDPGLARQVHAALESLPEEQRQAVILHRLEQLGFPEIAEMVGASESAVKVRAFRGYERLRKLLKGVWHETVE